MVWFSSVVFCSVLGGLVCFMFFVVVVLLLLFLTNFIPFVKLFDKTNKKTTDSSCIVGEEGQTSF